MTRYILDTNILSDLIRNPQGPIFEKIGQVGEHRICTSLVVAAELRFGAEKRGSDRLTAQVDSVLSVIDVISLEQPVDEHYAMARNRLEPLGQPIGGNDLLIASQALSLGYTVVTDNEREFRRVQGLHVENWLRTS
jgi:tRNA(fMet)-specific endonuclease VapC